MNLDISFGVNGIRETSKLRDSTEIRNEVLADLSGTSRLADVFEFLVVDSVTGTGAPRDQPTSTMSSAAFFENWRNVNKSSTWTTAFFAASAAFFSAAFFYK